MLEHERVTRIGDVREREIDIRIVAATNRHLEAEVAAGPFRSDLHYRLSVGKVWLPPLRDRRREIAILAQRFLEHASERERCGAKQLSDDALRLLSMYHWPGNIRELQNLTQRTAAAVESAVVEACSITASGGSLRRCRSRQAAAVPASAESPAQVNCTEASKRGRREHHAIFTYWRSIGSVRRWLITRRDINVSSCTIDSDNRTRRGRVCNHARR